MWFVCRRNTQNTHTHIEYTKSKIDLAPPVGPTYRILHFSQSVLQFFVSTCVSVWLWQCVSVRPSAVGLCALLRSVLIETVITKHVTPPHMNLTFVCMCVCACFFISAYVCAECQSQSEKYATVTITKKQEQQQQKQSKQCCRAVFVGCADSAINIIWWSRHHTHTTVLVYVRMYMCVRVPRTSELWCT